MTTIAWDGEQLVADKAVVMSGHRALTCKARKLASGFLVAGTGSGPYVEEMIAWFSDGADPSKFPTHQRDLEKCAMLIVVSEAKVVKLYDGSPYPILIEDQQYAIGSGSHYALAAMHLGKNAIAAIEVAAHFDPNTSAEYDALGFEPQTATVDKSQLLEESYTEIMDLVHALEDTAFRHGWSFGQEDPTMPGDSEEQKDLDDLKTDIENKLSRLRASTLPCEGGKDKLPKMRRRRS